MKKLLSKYFRRRVVPYLILIISLSIYFLCLFSLRSAPQDEKSNPIALALENKLHSKKIQNTILVTIASLHSYDHQEFEDGELKAKYIYPISVDNKARYCNIHNFQFFVGGKNERVELEKRSSRWNKVAWLIELLQTNKFDMIIWMDLDAFFIRADVNIMKLIDSNFDLHFTMDGIENSYIDIFAKVNTGFFVIKNSEFSLNFLRLVWDDNDGGKGESDQNSFNKILWKVLSQEQRTTHLKIYARNLLNAFPHVKTKYIPTEAFTFSPMKEDENSATIIVHFTGSFGGERTFDKNTPPLMLIQFLRVLVRRHLKFVSFSEPVSLKNSTRFVLPPSNKVIDILNQITRVSDPCMRNVSQYYIPFIDSVNQCQYYIPPDDEHICHTSPIIAKIYLLLFQFVQLFEDPNVYPPKTSITLI